MEDMQVIVTLLTIIVGLLSLVTLALLGVLIALLVKLRRVAKKVDSVTANLARATEWLSPTKVFGAIAGLFDKR